MASMNDIIVGESIEAAGLLHNIVNKLPPDIDSKRLDARMLLGLALGRQGCVYPHEMIDLSTAALHRLQALMTRRIAGEPVSRLRGTREFYGLSFNLNTATLDPRPDSEILVSESVDWLNAPPPPQCNDDNPLGDNPLGDNLRGDNPRVVDFGTGSGCLLLALLHHCPQAQGVGVDISQTALACARKNAVNLNLAERAEFHLSDWDKALDGCFDVVLANPPYIASADIGELMPEVRLYDPTVALDGGDDGLDCYRQLLPAIKRRLANHGRAFVEIGAGQCACVSALAASAGLDSLEIGVDLGRRQRCLILKHATEK